MRLCRYCARLYNMFNTLTSHRRPGCSSQRVTSHVPPSSMSVTMHDVHWHSPSACMPPALHSTMIHASRAPGNHHAPANHLQGSGKHNMALAISLTREHHSTSSMQRLRLYPALLDSSCQAACNKLPQAQQAHNTCTTLVPGLLQAAPC